jgi:hypothetical protein
MRCRLALNGIEDIGTRSDLLDRCLIVELPRIEPDKRKAEADFWPAFEEARPLILGALFDAVSTALRNLPAVRQSAVEWPRMADFAQWATAAEPALGLEEGAFLSAYERSRDAANQTALESSPVVIALLQKLKLEKDGRFEGTATELLDLLSIGQDTRAKGWPNAPRVLSGMLSRLAPNLRKSRVSVEQGRRGDDKIWIIRLAPKVAPSKSPSPSSRTQSTQCSQESGTTLQPMPDESPFAKFLRRSGLI